MTEALLVKHDFVHLRKLFLRIIRGDNTDLELDIFERELLDFASNNVHKFDTVRIGKNRRRIIYEIIPSVYYFSAGSGSRVPCFYFVAKNFVLCKFKEHPERRTAILKSRHFFEAVIK